MNFFGLSEKFKVIPALCYDCICDVYEYKYDFSKKLSSEVPSLIKVYEGIPCRVSYENFGHSRELDDINSISVGIKLFWRGDDASIKEGSVIHVFKNGKEVIFESAGGAACYGSHSEIKLIAFKNKA